MDSSLEGNGFEISVPRCLATANSVGAVISAVSGGSLSRNSSIGLPRPTLGEISHRGAGHQPCLASLGLRSIGPGPTEASKPLPIWRGTEISNPFPSSKQSVSRQTSPSCVEKPAAAAVCAGPPRRHRWERRAGLVNITPTAGNISVGPFSSTAVPARRIADVVAVVRPSELGSPRDLAM